MASTNVRNGLCAALLVIGAWQFGHGVWIYAKAQLAQLLIAHAWSELERHGGDAAKPWPWADTRPVARLRWPAGGVDLFVLDGAHGSALAFGPGVLDGSAGQVIAGHRDTHFRFLADLDIDDELRLRDHHGERRFRVADLRVVDSEREALVVAPGELVLVTCYPFDAIRAGGPLRYRVSALPVETEDGVWAM
jgi:sortase A